ncbi:response regulator [Deinococcus petrolearius]|uniref:Response regulator n=1 Tax=Deinococcus petrolearius TaxID=1751295 RepID=A0ABW1DHW4_9DEIO
MGSVHILLVDDSPGELLLAQEAFSVHAQAVRLSTFSDARDAMAWLGAASSDPPDLILADINLPGLNGLEWLQALKEEPSLLHIPVVVMSVGAPEHQIAQAYALRACGYLPKAATFGEFQAQIDALVGFWSRCLFARPAAPAPRD